MVDFELFWDGYGLTNINSGIFVHSRNLLNSLTKIGIAPNILTFPEYRSLFSSCPEKIFAISSQESWNVVNKIKRSKPVWPQLSYQYLMNNFPSSFKKKKIIFHGLSNVNLPLLIKTSPNLKYVLTVHDIIPLLMPSSVSKMHYFQFKFLLPLALKRADKIITVSNWSKRTILAKYPEFAHKIIMIPNGMNENIFSPSRFKQERTEKNLTVFTVSRDEPYKNLNLIVDLARISPPEIKFIIVTDHLGNDRITKSAPDLIQSGHLSILKNIENDLLLEKYRDCDVYLSPSYLEGFCLPAAEAISRGVPVVYRSGSGIDEFLNEANAVALRNNCPADWLSAIYKALDLKSNIDFIPTLENHLNRLPSWSDVAILLKKVYDEI